MMKLKHLYENYDLAREYLKYYDHDEASLDRMLPHFRISSNAVYPFLTKDGAVCFLRYSPI